MPAPTQSNCPNCGAANFYDPQAAGQMLYCSQCGKPFRRSDQSVSYTLPAPQSNGFALASLILGIFFCIPICGILALVFGIIGLFRSREIGGSGRKMSITGITLGSISVVLVPLVLMSSILLPALNRAGKWPIA